jgi:hypothetical protein
MALVSYDINSNILVSIEYAITLLDAGYSRENILSNMASKGFGTVSRFSKKAIRKMKKGLTYGDALENQQMHEHHHNMKRLATIYKAEGDIRPMLDNLSKEIMKEKQLGADNLIDSMTSKLQKASTIVAFPILIFFVGILEDAFPGFQLIERPSLDYLVYGITLLILLVIILRMRYNEN